VNVCLAGAFAQVGANLSTTLYLLQMAGGSTPIIGMNYYNPNLARWLDAIPPSGAAGRELAEDTNDLTALFNDAVLEPVYTAFRVPVADVYAAYRTDRWRLRGDLPFNVFRICQFTWMCAAAPVGPDIHPNRRGHGVIARTFQKILDRIGVI